MRILLINQTWFAPELRRMGHEVLSCGTSPHLDHVFSAATTHIDHLLESLPNGFYPDRIVWHDNSCPLTVLGLEDCSIPSVMYSVDTHHHYQLHSYIAGSFDHILVAQKDFMEYFKLRGTPYSWFPLWASEPVAPSAEKKYGAVFVGTLNPELNPERVDFFSKLQKVCSITVTQGHWPSIFSASEIVVNQAVKGDLNFRVFEAMISGAMLLTETGGNGLLDLFNDGEHLVTYTPRDVDDAATKITALLGNIKRTRTIAAQGRAEILSKHLAEHRAAHLMEILSNLTKQPRDPRRHYGALMNLFVLSDLLEENNPPYAGELLRLALESAKRALAERAQPDTGETAYTAKVCLKHDLLNRETAGMEVIHAFAEAFPSSTLFALLKIRSLLNRGLTVEARQYASQSFEGTPPEHTFASAEDAAQIIMNH